MPDLPETIGYAAAVDNGNTVLKTIRPRGGETQPGVGALTSHQQHQNSTRPGARKGHLTQDEGETRS